MVRDFMILFYDFIFELHLHPPMECILMKVKIQGWKFHGQSSHCKVGKIYTPWKLLHIWYCPLTKATRALSRYCVGRWLSEIHTWICRLLQWKFAGCFNENFYIVTYSRVQPNIMGYQRHQSWMDHFQPFGGHKAPVQLMYMQYVCCISNVLKVRTSVYRVHITYEHD